MKTLFDIDVEGASVFKVIDGHMERTSRDYRSLLHDYFKKIGGPVDPLMENTTSTPNMDIKDDQEYLCDMWCEKKYMVMS